MLFPEVKAQSGKKDDFFEWIPRIAISNRLDTRDNQEKEFFLKKLIKTYIL